jgi:hypothetical protein
LKEATMWMERYKQFWNTSLDKLDTALADYQQRAKAVDDDRNDDAEGGNR